MKNKISFLLMGTALFLAPAVMSCVAGRTASDAHADGFISGADARKLISERGAILIDVRTPDEYKERHIQGALFFPVQTLDKDMTHLGDFDRPIVVFCRSGVRAEKAKQMMMASGFKEVYNMGGIDNWNP